MAPLLRNFAAWSLFAAAASSALAGVIERDNDGEFRSKCESFRIAGLGYVDQAGDAIYYAANDLVNITSNQQGILAEDLPAFCRVRLVVHTDRSADQSANTDIWLPNDFNSRLLVIGNGGFAGGIAYGNLGYMGVQRGFAALGSDTGHDAPSRTSAWALNNDAAIIDFAQNRALDRSTAAGKRIVQQYYGKTPSKSYFAGCSTGGRQALQFAQRYPDVFDGILAGAPASDWINLMAYSAFVRNLVEPVNGTTWTPGQLWQVIHQEVLKQCDKVIDGVDDGVIENPRLCNFRPESLACRPDIQNTTFCLTSEQVMVLRRILTDWYETDQELIFRRVEPGAEYAYDREFFSETIFPTPGEYFKYWAFNDTSFDVTTLTYNDVLYAKELNVGNITSIDPDITAFAKRGGKLIQYHGLIDPLIPPGSSVDYYNSVDLFLRTNTDMKTDSFYRHFPVPGLQHCSVGPGVNAFGAPGQDVNGYSSSKYDKNHDITAALVAWVEDGDAPDTIVAAHYDAAGGRADTSKGITFERPLCRYPSQSKYRGKGDWKDPSSWYCQYPPPF